MPQRWRQFGMFGVVGRGFGFGGATGGMNGGGSLGGA